MTLLSPQRNPTLHPPLPDNFVRYPDLRSPHTMTKRAWWLVGVGIVIPGSAQLLAGSRRVGRFAVASTFVLWGMVLLAFSVNALFPRFVFVLGNNTIPFTLAQLVFTAYAVLWAFLTLDTLRLVRLVNLLPKSRPWVAGVAIVATIIGAGGLGYGAVVAGSARSVLEQLFSDGQYKDPVEGQYNILLLGGDAGPDRTGLRPDSLSVVSINAETGATTIIGIPRNFEKATFSPESPLWGPFPDGYDCGDSCLINYLYTYGEEHPELYPDAADFGSNPGIEATRDAVAGVTGLTLQYFVLIDMQGFAQLIDSLGGVDIDVKERTALGAIEAPEPFAYVEVGPQHFDGQTALWYARSRYDTSDYARMERQRQVQEAVLTQFEPTNVLTKFQGIASAGVQVVSTDIPNVMVGGFVEMATKARALPLQKLELVPGVVDTLNPNYDQIHGLVDTMLHPR